MVSWYLSTGALETSARLEIAILVTFGPLAKVRVTHGEVVIASPLLRNTWKPPEGSLGGLRRSLPVGKAHPVLLPPSVILFPMVTIWVLLVLLESETETEEILLVP